MVALDEKKPILSYAFVGRLRIEIENDLRLLNSAYY